MPMIVEFTYEELDPEEHDGYGCNRDRYLYKMSDLKKAKSAVTARRSQRCGKL